VDATKGFVPDEAFQGLDAKSELAQGKRALSAKAAGAQTVEMFGKGVLRAVDDAEILAAAAFDARLDDAAAAFFDEA